MVNIVYVPIFEHFNPTIMASFLLSVVPGGHQIQEAGMLFHSVSVCWQAGSHQMKDNIRLAKIPMQP